MSNIRQRSIQKGNGNGRMKVRAGQFGFSAGGSVDLKKMAFQANAKANYALSQLNTEKKVVGTTASALKNDVLLLNGLSEGTGNNDRIGQTVRFKDLSMRIAFTNLTAETIWLRYIIVRDAAPKGVVPAITDVLQGSSVQSFRNLDNTGRFKILEDKVLTLQYSTVENTSPSAGFTSIYIDLEGLKGSKQQKNKSKMESNYGLGNAGTIADISSGAYYLMIVTSAVANEAVFSYQSRMRYLDN